MNFKSSLVFHYILSAIFIFAVVIIAVVYSSNQFETFFVTQLEKSLKSKSMTVHQSIQTESIGSNHCSILNQSDPEVRVTIINNTGEVLCDNQADYRLMENHKNRPEVVKALNGLDSSNLRFSSTLNSSLLYVAIPWVLESNQLGVIRTAYPLFAIENLMSDLFSSFYILLSFMLLSILIAVFYSYKKINKPLAEIVDHAQKLSKGSLKDEIPHYDIQEINQLGITLNTTFNQLDHLENLRQEFVSNVSHELKTPIATIRSYVETLLDGASLNENDLQRFLSIVLKQNNRLSHIVDDLLMLSRLESAPIDQLINRTEVNICSLVDDVEDYCQARANTKNISIVVDCPKDYYVHADYSLILQAFSNLLDNAIKYSADKTEISIKVEKESQSVINIYFKDQGPGIEEVHIPRLFERFYRVDKSRSRKEGGTGLGLAIVKHILLIHKGSIRVNNNSGAGCCFTVSLPYKG